MSDDVDISGAQHYVECVMCDGNAEFHCNTCGDELCPRCKIKHLKSNASKNHTVVLYKERNKASIKEMCKAHPTFSYDMCCSQCEVPVCIRCMKEKHQGHTLEDTEVIYESIKSRSDAEIAKIKEQVLPLCGEILGDVKNNDVKCRKDISEIRETMTTKAKAIKEVVDDVLSENMEILDGIQNSLISELQNEEKYMNSYINTLQETISKYEEELKTSKTEFILVHKKIENLREIPELSEVVLPSFTEGQINRDVIADILGKITIPSSISPLREMKSHTRVRGLKLLETSKQISSFSISDLADKKCCHVSCMKSGGAWLSDFYGNLIMIDCNGKKLHNLKTIGGQGYHTVTAEDELWYINENRTCINRLTGDMKIKTVVKIEGEPCSICPSRINDDILVAVYPRHIIRFNKDGRELDRLYFRVQLRPAYIAENRNGDIIVSNFNEVKAFNAKGKPCFTYTGHSTGSKSFFPWGITTDILGHILVCNWGDFTIHILNEDGKFLSYLSTSDGKISDVVSIGIDNQHNIWLAKSDHRAHVFKYLEQI